MLNWNYLQSFYRTLIIQFLTICWTILKLWLSFYSSHMKDGLFISLNPMNHNWNLIPFRWTFWNYLPFFLGHWFQDLSAPDAAIFPEFNPYILYQEFWLSNKILNHVVCSIGKCSMCWQILLLFITHSSYDGFFLFLQLWTCCEQILLYPPSHHPLLWWSPPHKWGSLSWDDN